MAAAVCDRHRDVVNHPALLCENASGVASEYTFADLHRLSNQLANVFLSMGVKQGDRVAILLPQRVEAGLCHIAAWKIGAVSLPLSVLFGTDALRYRLEDSGAQLLVGAGEGLEKIQSLRNELPALEEVIDCDDHKGGFWALLGQAKVECDTLNTLADDPAIVIYTSGTTGPPKGAMLSNANVEFASGVIVNGGGLYEPPPNPSDVILSYLPLCHVAERAVTTWTNAVSGAVVHFAESIDTVTTNLREVQPTLFFAVPRIWEKLKAGVEVRMAAASWIKKANYMLWMKVGRGIANSMLANGGEHTLWSRIRYAFGYVFLYRALRERIGLQKARASASAAAPISPEVLFFFFMMGVRINELYGMTENSAVATSNKRGRIKLGTVGEPQPGVEVKLAEGTGEILTRHPGNFKGYWNKPEATADTLDADGWLHTGDVGEWVDGSHLKIIDRIKDIIITAGGKNISPSELENSLKASPFIREAIVIGDQRPYLTVLVGIEEDTVGEWARAKRIPYTTYRDLSEREEVLKLVQGIIAQTNEATARVENLRKFRMITKALDHEDGDLTATQKVKRSALTKTFGPLIDDMYSGADALPGGDQSDVIVVARVEE